MNTISHYQMEDSYDDPLNRKRHCSFTHDLETNYFVKLAIAIFRIHRGFALPAALSQSCFVCHSWEASVSTQLAKQDIYCLSQWIMTS